jgi:hypothetical protein
MAEAQDGTNAATQLVRQLVGELKSTQVSAWSASADGYIVTVSKQGDTAASAYVRGVIAGEPDLADKLSAKVPPDVNHDPSQQSDG